MRHPRIFLDQALQTDTICTIKDDAAHHIAHVLRMRVGQQLILFNGEEGQFTAEIIAINRHSVDVQVGGYTAIDLESNLDITLVQGISRGQHMDYTLQKAVELGVKKIVPVMTEYGNVKLDNERLAKRHLHWQKIIIGACEQCGRNSLPVLEETRDILDWISVDTNQFKLILQPTSDHRLAKLDEPVGHMTLLVGPEGGFSQQEFDFAKRNGYQGLSLGPRILRTETAALAAISACQTLWGDYI